MVVYDQSKHFKIDDLEKVQYRFEFCKIKGNTWADERRQQYLNKFAMKGPSKKKMDLILDFKDLNYL